MSDEWSINFGKSTVHLTDEGAVFTHAGALVDKVVRAVSPYTVPYGDITAIEYKAPTIALGGHITVATRPGRQPHKQRNPGSMPLKSSMPKKNQQATDFANELLRRAGLSAFTQLDEDGLFQNMTPVGPPKQMAAHHPAELAVTTDDEDSSKAAIEGQVVAADPAPAELSRAGKRRAELEARQQQRIDAKAQAVDLFGAALPIEHKLKFGEQVKISELKKEYGKSVALQAHLQELVDKANSFSWSANRETQIFFFGPVTLLVPEATTITRQSGRLSGQGHLGVGLGHVGVGFSSGQRLNSRSVTTAGADQLQSKGVGSLRITTRGVTFSGATRVVASQYGDLVDVTMTGRRVMFTDQRNQAVWAVTAPGDVSSEIYGIVQELRSLEKRVTAGFHLDQFDEARVREVAGRWASQRIEGQKKARQALNEQYRAIVTKANERGR